MSMRMNEAKPSFTLYTSIPEPPKPKRNKLFVIGLPLIAVLFVFSLVQLQFDYSKMAQGFTKLGGYMGTMFPPDFSAWRHVLLAAVESLQVAILGSVLGIVVAFFLSFLAASNLTPHPFVAWIIRSAASLLRAIPTIVWALIFIVSVGLGPLPGVLAIAVSAAGMLVKVFAQSLEEIDKGVLEAMQSTGASWLQIVMQGIMPTVKTAFIAWCVLQLEGGIAESTILGAVGAGGIGYEMTHAMKSYNFAAALFVGLVVFVMVFSVEFVANRYKMKLKIRQN
ncbi:phosphonate ABC transporter, permease protein PhnE [Paenibacillus sp. FSL R5-0766]|uniref:phosphonate ABC transporter, permease protein PhnE n=1 Tax=unclassified Paenibacillus TaxID=185978 RepID=UPI00096CFA1E|nr:phosphonate ABC transporter, permease protein PhnE [Paenibacillus sp. FSL R5-0765]OMF56870.1 phosphonate ABC transporter, permease protein PhnE [Paenibacillus sp. FSL R5-0765]